jgi:radical SAM superfamily enzyme YgiQ (UPF0313 family)
MREIFHIIMIRPTRYGPDGYPLQWYKTFIASNTLSCIYALVADCRARQVLGEDVEIRLHAIDETVQRVNHNKLIKTIKHDGGKGLVMMVGVQTNHFPRAVDLAEPFLEKLIPVCIGGFHVSGCMAMFRELTPELRAAHEKGISLFAGEAEGQRLDKVIEDAYTGKLQSIYNHLSELPELGGEPVPYLPQEQLSDFLDFYATMDLGRGCPFGCSFCTVINVQGRKSRVRTTDDLETAIRKHHLKPKTQFNHNPLLRWYLKTKPAKVATQCYFLTDDNFSRNSNWEALLDSFIKLRKEEGFNFRLLIQVDAACHRIPGFIEKCVQAGVDQVFIGIESLRPENLAGANKAQNKIEEYRESILAWKRHPVVVYAAYIIGFPKDSRESVLADVETLKRELPIDIIHFTILTPLPGSEDHKRMVEANTWMDSDLNKYALCNRVTEHPLLTREEWESVYEEAYACYYTDAHIDTILKRMVALRSNKKKTTIGRIMIYAYAYKIYGIHPIEVGLFHRKSRKDRQPGRAIESPLAFYPKYAWQCLAITAKTFILLSRLHKKMNAIWTDPNRYEYNDIAIMREEAELSKKL